MTNHVSYPRFASFGTSTICFGSLWTSVNTGRYWLTWCSLQRRRSGCGDILSIHGSSIGGSNWCRRIIHSRTIRGWRRIECIFIFRNELLACTNPINPNQWIFSKKGSKITSIINEWKSTYISYIFSIPLSIYYALDIGPSDHVFHDVQPAFDWSHQHPPVNDGKPGFGGKDHVHWDKHIKSWFAKKNIYAWSNGSKIRQRSWNALTLGWEWTRMSGYRVTNKGIDILIQIRQICVPVTVLTSLLRHFIFTNPQSFLMAEDDLEMTSDWFSVSGPRLARPSKRWISSTKGSMGGTFRDSCDAILVKIGANRARFFKHVEMSSQHGPGAITPPPSKSLWRRSASASHSKWISMISKALLERPFLFGIVRSKSA